MLLSYIRLSFRLLLRNPFFAAINVFGLAIGFTSFFTLWQYSMSELKTDQHHKDFERISRIGFEEHWLNQEGQLVFSASKASLLPQLKQDFPEVESFVRISEQRGFFQNDLHEGHGIRIVMSHIDNFGNKKIFKETKLAYADRNIFQFFGIPLLSGNEETVLAGVNYVALSRSTSERYFGSMEAMGRQITLNDSITLTVSGVYEDPPHNSRLKYDMIISNEGLLTKWNNVYWGGVQNFIKLRGSSFKEFENKLRINVTKYWADNLATCNDGKGCKIIPFVQPITEIAFRQGLIGDDDVRPKSRSLLITLGWVALIVLAMAWINYTNLTLSKLANRMKEFSTRRANGAREIDLIWQFLTETVMINILAIGLSFTTLQVIRSPLSIYFHIPIADFPLITAEAWIVLFIVIPCGILITGMFPAYLCLRRLPGTLQAIKAVPSNKNFISTLLTTFQFASSIVLILWSFVIYHQLNYILEKDTGYTRDGIVVIDAPITSQVNYEQKLVTWIDQLHLTANVTNATMSRCKIGEIDNKPGSIRRQGTMHSPGVECNAVDENFIPLFNLKLIAGRNFIAHDRSDVVIISRTAARDLGYKNPEEAIGSIVTLETGDWGVTRAAEVIGVIEEYRRFPFFDLSQSNTIYAAGGFGVFLTYKNKLFPELIPQKISVGVQMEAIDKLIASMESSFKTFFPADVFEWQFLDDSINQIYAYEQTTRNQILLFTLVAISIACIGLIGMMNQQIPEKTKEIGIRKILGADLHQIAQILLSTTVKQIGIATALGIPLAYYLTQQYQQKFSERMEPHWWHYALPVLLLVLIMLTTVSTTVWRAATGNPVDALKHE